MYAVDDEVSVPSDQCETEELSDLAEWSDSGDDDPLDLAKETFNVPAYGGALYTVADFVQHVRHFAVHAKLNDVDHTRLLQLLHCLLPASERCPFTLHKFRKVADVLSPPVPVKITDCCFECGGALKDGFCQLASCKLRPKRQYAGYGYAEPDLTPQVMRIVSGKTLL